MTLNNNDNKDIEKDDKNKFGYMKKAEDWVCYTCTFIFAVSVISFIGWAFSLGH